MELPPAVNIVLSLKNLAIFVDLSFDLVFLLPHFFVDYIFANVLVLNMHSFTQYFLGIFVDKTKKYEETMKVAMGLAVVFGLTFMQVCVFAIIYL